MARLSDIAIAQAARSAGFSGSGLITAVAVALAESAGDPQARGYNKSSSGVVTSVDRGLWQINSVYHAEVSDACAFSPSCAAGAAFRISRSGSTWTPWSTYNSGAYRQFVQRASAAANSGTAPSGSAATATPPTTASATPLAWQQLVANAQGATTASTGQEVVALGASDAAGSVQKRFWRPYQQLVAGFFFFGVLYVLSRTKAGYVAIYYGEVLILLFLFATQAQYFREGLLPFLSQSHGESPATVPTPPNTLASITT